MSNRLYVVRTSLIVAIGGFLMGFDASVISGVIRFIENEFSLEKLQIGWAVGSSTLAAAFAMMGSGPLSDRIGRKKVLYLAATLYTASAVASALAPSFVFLVVARMIGGLGVGASLIIAPMYIAEFSPPDIRGRMVSFNQLNIVLGISTAFFTNYLIVNLGTSDTAWAQSLLIGPENWRWMLGLETLPAAVYFCCLFAVPESPRWLVMHGRHDGALDVLSRITDRVNAESAVENIRSSLAASDLTGKAGLKDLFSPTLRRVLIIGIVIAIVQQITGINAVLYYAPIIFEQSGIGTNASFAQAVLVGIVNLLFTIVAILFIDRLGRKRLLVIGLTGIAASMLLLSFGFRSATYTLTPESIAAVPAVADLAMLDELHGVTFENDVAFKSAIQSSVGDELARRHESDLIKASITINPILILIGMLGFVASFAVSIGPVMWVLFSELFPNWIRGLAVSFVGLLNSATSFCVQLLFPWELANLGTATTFLLYALFAAIGLVFVLLKVPETKGMSLEELEGLLVGSAR
ncbi:MAG: sugar porter family MFS transporter [Bacteroidetes bacterium]|nr:sugar porter family MFS transporter [Bacteroidota bacterium]